MPLPGFLRLPSIRPISSHFTHFQYVTGTRPAVTLMLIPRVSGLLTFQVRAGPLNELS